ncbi:MAG: methyl-accepting chemotaxis sensory transducer [Conexibacter sp.]|nr:methyl-accepting chemotaxis sensory transducer [Conexibacter sp.]
MKGLLGVRWTVGLKNGLAFGAVTLFLLGIAVAAIVTLDGLRSDHERIVGTALPRLAAAERDRLTALDHDFNASLSSGRTLVLVLAIVGALTAIALAVIITLALRHRVRRVLARLHHLRDDCVSSLNRGLGAVAGGDMTVAVEPTTRPIERISSDEIGEIALAVNEILAKTVTSIAEYETMREQLRAALGDRSCLAPLTERLERLEANCLTELEQGLSAMARGDLTRDATPTTTPLPPSAGADLGRLAEIFNAMLARAQTAVEAYGAMREKVVTMLGEISDSSASVTTASQQMASTSEDTGRAIGEIATTFGEVAQGAERQVRSVAQARQLTEEVATASRVGAENAQGTAAAAQQARAVAQEGAEAVARATEAIRAVHATSTDATAAIRELGAKSQRIGGIVGTITGIAEQTNLLALNAAIEAARAGEQGRGFAVVAEEVRKLAEESQRAAGSIAGLVEEIQRETGHVVGVVETGAEQTEAGAATVEQARASFERIGTSVDDMSGRVERIAAAVAQIAASAGQMQSSIAQVAAVAEQSSAASEEVSASTQQTSASTQQIAVSAHELAKTAEELDTLVGQFTLR